MDNFSFVKKNFCKVSLIFISTNARLTSSLKILVEKLKRSRNYGHQADFESLIEYASHSAQAQTQKKTGEKCLRTAYEFLERLKKKIGVNSAINVTLNSEVF